MVKKSFSILLVFALCLSMLAGCGNNESTKTPDISTNPEIETQKPEDNNESISEVQGIKIELSDTEVLVDGLVAPTDAEQVVYTANDIVYYETGHDFTYGEGTETDAHSKEEADKHTVVHITKPGNYILTGTIKAGQIAVDLGEDAKEDPNAVVTLYLNGVDITNTVAPGIIFYNVYECYPNVSEETATKDVDTSKAGANIVIVDDTKNSVNGSYVARIYKPDSVILSENGKTVEDSKKLHKYDAAVYSKMTMNVNGGDNNTGVLNINAENEGLDTELHLTINGGIINIESGNDGINTNEDYVSVTTINGGSVNILVNGNTGEGDGIDSNGWLVINGGSVISQACSFSGDAGIDSDNGIHINGGHVFATGNMLDQISESESTFVVFNFTESQAAGIYTLKDSNNNVVIEQQIDNDFMYMIISSENLLAGEYTLWSGDTQFAGVSVNNMGMGRPDKFKPNGEMPEGFVPPERGDFEKPEADFGLVENVELPVGGMHTAREEVPTVPHDLGNNWDANIDRAAITGGSAITMKPDRENMTPPEDGFKGGFPGESEADFGKGPFGKPGAGSSWGASSSEISSTFNIIDGANYFSSLRKVSVVE